MKDIFASNTLRNRVTSHCAVGHKIMAHDVAAGLCLFFSRFHPGIDRNRSKIRVYRSPANNNTEHIELEQH